MMTSAAVEAEVAELASRDSQPASFGTVGKGPNGSNPCLKNQQINFLDVKGTPFLVVILIPIKTFWKVIAFHNKY